MKNLTEMEKKVLEAFTKDDFYEDLESTIWSDVFLDTIYGWCGIESNKARGVLSSLVKKGIIDGRGFSHTRDSMGRRDDVVFLTDEGIQVMRSLGYGD